ncbi:conserved protein of unknown function [Pseudomonas marincola]|uniref:Uncharacterized protein n=1 Tax=Pseudomonas marincola TaxID=437900 RepID=A0A653E1A0_9PSED|nr:conserved protein of unknown function [Pseudomonas marincola]
MTLLSLMGRHLHSNGKEMRVISLDMRAQKRFQLFAASHGFYLCVGVSLIVKTRFWP